jgi:hypothetical protein
VIVKDQTVYTSALKGNLQPATDLMLEKWRGLDMLWVDSDNPNGSDLQSIRSLADTGLTQCRRIADFLFTHSGKTARSQTYLSVLMKLHPTGL